MSRIFEPNWLTVARLNDRIEYTLVDATEARAVQIVLSRREHDVTVRLVYEGSSVTVRPSPHDNVSVAHDSLTNEDEEAAETLAATAIETGLLTVTRGPTLLERNGVTPNIDESWFAPEKRDSGDASD